MCSKQRIHKDLRSISPSTAGPLHPFVSLRQQETHQAERGTEFRKSPTGHPTPPLNVPPGPETRVFSIAVGLVYFPAFTTQINDSCK